MGLLALLGFKGSRDRNASTGESLPLPLFPIGEYNAPVTLWANSIRDLGQSQSCRLRKLVQCKETTGSQHEFLLVFILHPSGKEAIVLVDRKETCSGSNSVLAGTDKQAWAVAAQKATRSDVVKVSYDGTRQCLTRHSSGYSEIHSLKFPKASKAPSVAHLAALLMTLSRHSLPPTPGFEMQSSWFVYTAVEVLKEIFGGDEKMSKKWVRVPYGGMRVSVRDTVESLILEYTATWEEFSRGLRQKGSQLRVKDKKQKTVQQEKKRAKKQEEMDSFADMLRTMNS
ncbi:hypothetical protein F5I97DRAFT_1840711 [Phlebopus sp. FC_14]|nr:hypothetical protein F5I97DRAFT_1840711 [Phlebopus sp. FC_14]